MAPSAPRHFNTTLRRQAWPTRVDTVITREQRRQPPAPQGRVKPVTMEKATMRTSAPLSQLRLLASLPVERAVEQAASVLTALSHDPLLYQRRILPLLSQPVDPAPISIVPLSDAAEAVSVQLFVWLPGAATQIHDHSSWGAVGCVVGSLLEERYTRLDDGARSNYARLRKAWRRVWTPVDGVSTFLPYAEGIHRVGNPSPALAVSLHCYGPPGGIDGRDYDPNRDFVCDRLHERHEAGPSLFQ